nr:MAG TPA: Nematocyst outer wall antigen evolution, nematocyst, bridge state [Caudoviricetes sp.]
MCHIFLFNLLIPTKNYQLSNVGYPTDPSGCIGQVAVNC